MLELLRTCGIFDGVSEAALSGLAERATCQEVESGGILARKGLPRRGVMVLLQGTASLHHRNYESGVAVQLDLVDAPALLGEAEWAAASPWISTIRAESDVTIVSVNDDDFLRCVVDYPHFLRRLYHRSCARQLDAQLQSAAAATCDTRSRIIRLLLEYVCYFGARDGNVATIDRPLTQVQIARALGLTRKTVQRTLQPLRERGVVEIDSQGHWVIRDLSRLESRIPEELRVTPQRHGNGPVSAACG